MALGFLYLLELELLSLLPRLLRPPLLSFRGVCWPFFSICSELEDCWEISLLLLLLFRELLPSDFFLESFAPPRLLLVVVLFARDRVFWFRPPPLPS